MILCVTVALIPYFRCVLPARQILVVLPHIIIGSAALIRVGIILIAMLASLSKIVLSIRNAVAASSSAICIVLRVMRVTRVLVIRIAVLVPLNMVSIFLGLP
jgi:hypothetical protein